MSAPLSDYEKFKALIYLGYSVFEDDGPAIRAFNSLPSHPIAPDFIRPILDKLDQLQQDIHSVRPIAKAISTGDTETRALYTLNVLWKMGRQLVNQLSSITKVSIFSDVFSSGGAGRNPATFYSGDPSEHRVGRQLGVPTTRSGS